MTSVKLRQATELYHKRLEEKLDLLNRLRTIHEYEKLLQRFFGFYVPLEDRIVNANESANLLLNFTERRKAALLIWDLQALGVDEDELKRLPLCQRLPAVESAAQIYGCMYVLEGATLGGQIISRFLDCKFGLNKKNGAAFFNGYGEKTGRMWKLFGATLNEFSSNEAVEASIIQSACETFIKFDQWLFEGAAK